MKHYNPSLVVNARRILEPKGEYLSDEVLPNITPVLEINKPITNIIRNGTTNASGTTTIFILPADKDFYLTSIHFSLFADSASDLGNVTVRVNQDGAARDWNWAHVTLNSAFFAEFLCFEPPIRLDRGTSILMIGTHTVGNNSRTCTITGYTQESTQSQ